MCTLPLQERLRYMKLLEQVVMDAGSALLKVLPTIEYRDIRDFKGHETSSVDTYARQFVLDGIERLLPEYRGKILFELTPISRAPYDGSQGTELFLFSDELDGTTNTKRKCSSPFRQLPLAIISLALSTSARLSDVFASAVFCLNNSEVFTAVRAEDDSFMAFNNRRLIDPDETSVSHGDSRDRVLVIGYSNSYRMRKGEVEQVLYDTGLRVYEGCRSSGSDLLEIVGNGSDGYVDLRSHWSTKGPDGREREAQLQVYDVAGTVPVALGCGLIVTDGLGNPWQEFGSTDSISIVVARPAIHKKIIDAIKPLIESWMASS